MTFSEGIDMSLISFAGVCAGAVLVFLGAASFTITGEFGVREAYAILGGGLFVLASMYIYVKIDV